MKNSTIYKRLREKVRSIKKKRSQDPRRYPHHYDGMATSHNDGFMRASKFKRAYTRACLASGWDYQIPWRVHQALWAAEVALGIEGDFVELGTGRGFIMSAVLDSISDWSRLNRQLWLFDTFMPFALDEQGQQSAASRKRPYYAESLEAVTRNFAEWANVRIVQGQLPGTLYKTQIEKIAFLHIDLNHPDPEVASLRYLWPRISKGGIVLLDDYAYARHQSQYEVINALAEEIGFSILSTPTGQGIIVR
jgi:hypothetical protein